MVNNQNEDSKIKEKPEPSQQLLTYDEVLQQTTAENRAVLLGNGFSMAYNKKRFSFTSLLSSAIKDGIIKENGAIHKLFQNLNTADFEYVIRLLEDATIVLESYNIPSVPTMTSDIHNLKEYLIQTITNNHPDKCTVLPKRNMNVVKNSFPNLLLFTRLIMIYCYTG